MTLAGRLPARMLVRGEGPRRFFDHLPLVPSSLVLYLIGYKGCVATSLFPVAAALLAGRAERGATMSLKYHKIAEANHHILNPFTDDKLMLLGEVARLKPGM